MNFKKLPRQIIIFMGAFVLFIGIGLCKDNAWVNPEVVEKPPLKGRVIKVDANHNFIVIDLGEEDGVKLEIPFFIYRDNEEIAQFLRDNEDMDLTNKIIIARPKMVKQKTSRRSRRIRI